MGQHRTVPCAGGCGKEIRPRKTGYCSTCLYRSTEKPVSTEPKPPLSPVEQLASDRELRRTRSEIATLRIRYQQALDTIESRDEQLGVLKTIQSNVDPIEIVEHHGGGTSEATPVILLSDSHSEELVNKETVNGLNEYNLEIAQLRMTEFFQGAHRLVKLLNQDVHIYTVVCGLLGDFITNQIHGAENAETNQLQPVHAIVAVQNWIIGGIEFWLNHTPYNFVFVCKSGNHARTTQTTRFSAETGHSLEYMMFLHLAAYFRNEKRVRFIIEDGIHSYLPVYDLNLRFHHGHAVKYGGGVGGITIPVNKAIAQWDKGQRADIDFFGHFHQRTVMRKWVCNGSIIGYNGYAMSIKADYEPPMQHLSLIDKKRGHTATWPILFTK